MRTNRRIATVGLAAGVLSSILSAPALGQVPQSMGPCHPPFKSDAKGVSAADRKRAESLWPKSYWLLPYAPERLTSAEASVAVDPTRPGVWLYVGSLRFNAGDLEGAIAAYCEAWNQSPADATNRSNIMDALRRQRRYRDAVEVAELSVHDSRIRGNDVFDLYRHLGDILVEGGDRRAASEAYAAAASFCRPKELCDVDWMLRDANAERRAIGEPDLTTQELVALGREVAAGRGSSRQVTNAAARPSAAASAAPVTPADPARASAAPTQADGAAGPKANAIPQSAGLAPGTQQQRIAGEADRCTAELAADYQALVREISAWTKESVAMKKALAGDKRFSTNDLGCTQYRAHASAVVTLQSRVEAVKAEARRCPSALTAQVGALMAPPLDTSQRDLCPPAVAKWTEFAGGNGATLYAALDDVVPADAVDGQPYPGIWMTTILGGAPTGEVKSTHVLYRFDCARRRVNLNVTIAYSDTSQQTPIGFEVDGDPKTQEWRALPTGDSPLTRAMRTVCPSKP